MGSIGAGRQKHFVSPFRSLKEVGDWITAGGRDPHDEVNMIDWGKPASDEDILELCREIERDTGEASLRDRHGRVVRAQDTLDRLRSR